MSEQLSHKAPELLTVNKETSFQEIENLVSLRTSQLQEAKIALEFLKAQKNGDQTLPFDVETLNQEIALELNNLDYMPSDVKFHHLLIENDYLRDKIAQLTSNRHEAVRGLKSLTDQEDSEIMFLDFENATLKNEVAKLNEALLEGRPDTVLRKFGRFLITRI